MVRKKNILATVMQSFAITCLVSIVWTVIGYSEAFTSGTGALAPYIGDTSRFMLNGMEHFIAMGDDAAFTLAPGPSQVVQTIPESVYMMFQMTFRHHHPRADRRRVRGPHEVLRHVHLHGAVVDPGLLADRALGVGADRLAEHRKARWISPAARWCISTPVSPG